MTHWKKTWVYRPPRNPKVPDGVKVEVEAKAKELVEHVLKPKCIEPPPRNPRFNYIVDIFTKWHGGHFYFVAKYACPFPNATSPFFEVNFTRLQYLGDGAFNLAYMRHTGQWVEVYHGLTLDECISTIRDEALFHP